MVNDWKQIAYKKLDADADIITLGDTTAKTAEALFGTSANQVIEDFSTYTDQTDADTSWVRNDTVTNKARVDVITNKLDFDYDYDNTNHAIVYDLGAGNVSDDAWTLRFNITLSTNTKGSGKFTFGLSDSDESVGQTGNQDFIGIVFDQASGLEEWGVADSNGGALPNGGIDDITLDMITGTTYYFEIKRVSKTLISANRYTDSTYTVSAQTSRDTTFNTVNSLRYVKLTDRLSATSGQQIGEIDDIQFWNGTNTVVEGGFEPHDMMKLVTYTIPTGGTIAPALRMNEYRDAHCSTRINEDGGTDSTSIEQKWLGLHGGSAVSQAILYEVELLDFPNQEKLVIVHEVETNALGSATAPKRGEIVTKSENQVDIIITLSVENVGGTGDFKEGSYAILYGANRPTITHANGNTLVEVQGDTI